MCQMVDVPFQKIEQIKKKIKTEKKLFVVVVVVVIK